jgi:hypothetical protein
LSFFRAAKQPARFFPSVLFAFVVVPLLAPLTVPLFVPLNVKNIFVQMHFLLDKGFRLWYYIDSPEGLRRKIKIKVGTKKK